jgi:hypothetical protein
MITLRIISQFQHFAFVWCIRNTIIKYVKQCNLIHVKYEKAKSWYIIAELIKYVKHVRSDNRQKGVQQLVDNRAQYFVVCWFSIIFFLSYYFLNLLIFFFFRIHITPGWRRDTRMIPLPIQIWIRICGWRQDRLVDPIEIGCTVSLTLPSRTCGWHVVFQPLDSRNQFRALKLWS